MEFAKLLNRNVTEPDTYLMSKNIAEHNVLVTGAGGTIGSELCRKILSYNPKSLILFELSEYNLYSIEHEIKAYLAQTEQQTPIFAIIGNIQNKTHFGSVLEKHKVHTIYHAAAHKHVPMVENNIVEAVKNNVFGTLSCAEAAIEHQVANFTLISTDKAVRPTNVMGATKRLSELILQALSIQQSSTCFTMVRFGNVLGSSGSVIPLFLNQIQNGGPLTVTHPDITRYFMLVSEASELVIQASAIGHSGQVFVLDMGEPIKIHDLAKNIIKLTQTKQDIQIVFSGLRPGEKLFEELLIGENASNTIHPKIKSATEVHIKPERLNQILASLKKYCHLMDKDMLKTILLAIPTGYKIPKHQQSPTKTAEQVCSHHHNGLSLEAH